MDFNLNGDVRSPEDTNTFLANIEGVYSGFASTDEQSGAALASRGVTGPAVELTAAMHAASSHVAASIAGRVARFQQHIAARDAHVSDDLAGTQAGKYLDPAAQ